MRLTLRAENKPAEPHARNLTPEFDYSPIIIGWDSASKTIYARAQVIGVWALFRIDVDGGVERITDPSQSINVGSINALGQAAGIEAAKDTPAQVMTFNAQSPAETSLVYRANAQLLDSLELGDVKEIWADSSDGFRVQGWYMLPPGYDPKKEYPMILAIHGGPYGMYTEMNPVMSLEWRYPAAQDYIVAWSNPRGSIGYGYEFANAIKNSYPGKNFDDLMAFTDAVVDAENIDEDNMFVYGCSGGGVLTAWIVGHTDRFAAASAECAFVNFLSAVGVTDMTELQRFLTFDKALWEDPEQYLKRSPLMYMGNVTTPT